MYKYYIFLHQRKVYTIKYSNTLPLLIFTWFLKFRKTEFMNSIFGLFRTWILQAKEAVKIKFKIDQKWSLSKSIFRNPFFKNQVQINRGYETRIMIKCTGILVTLRKQGMWEKREIVYYAFCFKKWIKN